MKAIKIQLWYGLLGLGILLGLLAIGGGVLTLGAIFLQGMTGLYCLVGVSACMSLMFPTIYGIALDGLTPNDAKLGSAGLIFAIVGGALMPRIQGGMIDGDMYCKDLYGILIRVEVRQGTGNRASNLQSTIGDPTM